MNRFKLDPSDIFCLGASISMCILSSGITYSLIRGSELQVEAVDTKLTLTGKINKTKQLTQELQQVSQELEKTNVAPKELSIIKEELEATEVEIEDLESEIIQDSVPRISEISHEENPSHN